MNITDFITTMAEGYDKPGLFPFPFNVHLIFACLGLVFFMIMYSREKKPYQLIMGIAIPFSLVLWLSDSKTLFYFVGAAEVLMLAAAFVSTFIWKKKDSTKTDEAAVADAAEIKAEETVGDDSGDEVK
ncbi:MAG: hypothetical protein IJX77_06050 [Ruminococcus sp.]|nr:hypothetical protein [Ruminococcus sp.]